MGIPVLSADHEARLDPMRLVDNTLQANVQHAFHAVAADEQRVDFSPTLWDADPRLVQRVFPGTHGDVGGGYPEGEESALSNLALAWMGEQLKGLGVKFANEPPFATVGSAVGPMHLPWTCSPYDVRPVAPREFPSYAAEGNAIAVDDSLRERMRHGPVTTVTATEPPVSKTGPYVPIALVNSGHLDVTGLATKP